VGFFGKPTERCGVQEAQGRDANEGQSCQAWDEPSVRRSSSHADAGVGTDDIDRDVHSATGRLGARRMTTVQVLEALDLGVASEMAIELTPLHGTRTFEVQRDLASLVCGRSAAALAIRLRWTGVAIVVLGATVPVLTMFAVHWANGGLGQFALAYNWPLWLEVWVCIGHWLSACVFVLWFASMQREIAWFALKQASTLWIVATTGVFVAGLISLYEFGIHRSTWVGLPVYIACLLFYPLIAMADGLPPKLRLRVLRFGGPVALGPMSIFVVVLRLPTAEDTPGELVWTVMGTDTVTNLQALTYSATVLAVLLAEVVLRAWMFPDELALIQMGLRVTERASGISASERPRLRAANSVAPTASVAPHALDVSSLR
jgi:hypothetical protein